MLPLAGIAPAHADAPKKQCDIVYGAQKVFWAMTCSEPGESMIGGFATWRNVPITFDRVATPHETVQASNYLRVTPNNEKSPFAPNIEIGLYAEKTGKTTSTYGPRWTELGKHGGRTKAITAGVNPNKADRRNHTYLTIRKDKGHQWDVLYDFNQVGSTTDQLKVVLGLNRIDTGLEVMGPQYVNVPDIGDRMQFLDLNRTWHRIKTKNTAKVISLPGCGKQKKPPYCFKTRLTGGQSFTQWTVGKPRKQQAVPAAQETAPPAPTVSGSVPRVFNGVDQRALQQCLAKDPDACLNTVPGLSRCVRTARVCNATALHAVPSSADPVAPAGVSASAVRARAAASFAVAPEGVSVTSARTPAEFPVASVGPRVWTVKSSHTTPGLEKRGLRFTGFRATYSAQTGQLLEACWGQMCRS
ncbi:hypothetical protein [Streptomyces sp. SAJ15]|uniref:hypothetical protein n=1 Tax=Streptomyces sp. SAJ15 TaxID=2011095 RepID=UPI0021B2854F|nr:hypothetical protein [Streptomyces sp. SAJ15]